MEYWRQCTLWLINCKVLPPDHRVTWESAQVFDLAQTLRDGVLLCQLLNNLRPQSINLKEINLRPQMSQFLCLRNIRTFLAACCETFGMKKTELFEAFDLFDVRDFGKVRNRTSTFCAFLSERPFPSEESLEEDEDIYSHLVDLIDEKAVEDEEDLYDCVYDDEDGGEIYEDLMKAEAKQVETDIRSCCLTEIKQTEEKYTETLDSIEKYFMAPLTTFLSSEEMEKVFVNIPALVKVHKTLNVAIQDSVCHRSAQNLYQIFINYKERLLIYGKYCSHVETAIIALDVICKDREDVRMKLEECAKRANHGKFTLRDLLVVPMQRVLKYPLLLQELVKHTHDAGDKSNLRMALDAIKDLAQYINEVKRDNETLRDIAQYQKSIENLNQSLSVYGRPKGDGEVRFASGDKRAKQDRHIFLFDAAVILCKRRGDNYEMKEVITLYHFKITNNPTSDKETRKWSYGLYLAHDQGQSGFEFFFKTKELRKKWLEQFGMAISNIRPENGTSNSHEFKMHTFDRITSCSYCHMLLRYRVTQYSCPLACSNQCSSNAPDCLPKMLVTRSYFGVPSPMCGPPLNIQQGDIIELVCADLHSTWWQVTHRSVSVGFFPSSAVKPYPCVSQALRSVFAGPMERLQAEAELISRGNSTYLVRHRSRELTEYAISIKYSNDVKHIKILNRDGCFHIAENNKFGSILELIEYYQHYSLREGFRSLDTTLQFPYREQESPAAMLCTNKPGGKMFTPKVIGVAKARYDFSSRDTRELSLQEGDVVKIYTKSGANGWWRGEVNGRVSAPPPDANQFLQSITCLLFIYIYLYIYIYIYLYESGERVTYKTTKHTNIQCNVIFT
uniref:Vav guanine nucleotide exchange factor 3 n=1 Tax=Oncorhynchus tshawytscha TaxID=74940 RepID=A0AAZ3NZP9_ONCTS